MAEDSSIRVKSLPVWTPGFVRSHPALLVEWLQVVNSLSRWREHRRRVAVLGVSAIAIVAALVASLSRHVVPIVAMLADYWLLVGVLAAVFAATTVNRRRRHIEESQSQSWLIATPIPPSSLRISHAIRTLFPLIITVVAVVVSVGFVALTNDETSAAVATLVGATAGGGLVGGAAGWWMSQGQKQTAVVASRYVPRPRASHSMKPDAVPLAQWPDAE